MWHAGQPAGTALTVNAPTSYTPGGAAVSMTVSIPGGRGFEATVETTPGNAPAGSFTAGANVGVSGQYVFSSVEGTSWTFSWTPPATNVGSVVLYITGGTNGPSYSNSYLISAAAAAPPDFSLSASAASLTVGAGASATDTITVHPTNGFTGNVTLTTSPLPSGVTPHKKGLEPDVVVKLTDEEKLTIASRSVYSKLD